MTMEREQFSLSWDNYQTNLSTGFYSLLTSEDLVDVTLAAEGKYIKAHKTVLSVCSPYFKELLHENPCKHPIVILQDVNYEVLKSILQFMYKGEVSVDQNEIPVFMNIAELLRIKGLTDNNSDANGCNEDESNIQDNVPTLNKVLLRRASYLKRTMPIAAAAAPSMHKRPRTCHPASAKATSATSEPATPTSVVASAPATSPVRPVEHVSAVNNVRVKREREQCDATGADSTHSERIDVVLSVIDASLSVSLDATDSCSRLLTTPNNCWSPCAPSATSPPPLRPLATSPPPLRPLATSSSPPPLRPFANVAVDYGATVKREPLNCDEDSSYAHAPDALQTSSADPPETQQCQVYAAPVDDAPPVDSSAMVKQEPEDFEEDWKYDYSTYSEAIDGSSMLHASSGESSDVPESQSPEPGAHHSNFYSGPGTAEECKGESSSSVYQGAGHCLMSKRSVPRLVVDGHTFYKKSVYKEKIFWNCRQIRSKHRCAAVCTTDNGQITKLPKLEHTHQVIVEREDIECDIVPIP